MSRLRFRDWPLRVKLGLLIALCSLLPITVAAIKDIHDVRVHLLANTEALLAARGEQLADQIDTFNGGYRNSAATFARLPRIVAFCAHDGDQPLDLLQVQPEADADIRGTAILDAHGVVRTATEPELVGVNLAVHAYVRDALQGRPVVSDIHLARVGAAFVPTVAYVHPVRGPDKETIGLVAIWVRATALWLRVKASNALAGPSSFAVMFTQDGIRIAHTYSHELTFHPGGALEPALVDALAQEERYGERTRQILEDVRPFGEQFERARAKSPNRDVFRGYSSGNQQFNIGVGRRLESVPWTIFYMVPEATITARIDAITKEKVLFALTIIFCALAVGALFASVILQPIEALSNATRAITEGDLSARVEVHDRHDELGLVSADFNAMARRIERQATALALARDELAEEVEHTRLANRGLESFSYSVAHDLRAPLRAMNGFSQLLLLYYGEKLDADARDWLNEIHNGATKMAELIDGLLLLARLTRSELTLSTVDLSALAREVVAGLRSAAPARNVDVVIADGLTVLADPRLARALLENLLGNAWKFTGRRDDARIEVGAATEERRTVYFVRDNGAGFDMAFAEKLFAPFHRLHTVEEFVGTGIGLATTKRIIDRHDGSIWAEGTVDGGATFFFTLHDERPRPDTVEEIGPLSRG